MIADAFSCPRRPAPTASRDGGEAGAAPVYHRCSSMRARKPRRTWPSVVLIAVLSACSGGGSSPSSPAALPTPAPTPTPDLGPPNVVIVLADDLGYGDLGTFGNTRILTPSLDKMAAEGAKFTDFYVDSPVCAPSRAALMTGRWPPRVGIPWNPPTRLNPDEYVLAEPLRDRGYATGMLGKWHLGWTADEMPVHYGFDYYYGIPAGEDENQFVFYDGPTNDIVGLDQLNARYVQYALKYIAGVGKDRRFFVYIATRDPHLPNYPPAGFAGRSGAGDYGDTIEALDASIGDLLKGLKDLGVDENTLVIFTSDNGPVVPPKGPGSAGGLSGAKGSCEEGGIRVPAIMRWPARIKPGRVVTEPVSTLDLFPTIVALTGATLPPRHYDGQDVSRLVTGEVDHIGGSGIDGGREIVFWQDAGRPGALRSGRWKYLRPGLWNTSPTLFDLQTDPGETVDLSKTHPDVAARLEQRLQEILAAN
jgi:arylsulfatase A